MSMECGDCVSRGHDSTGSRFPNRAGSRIWGNRGFEAAETLKFIWNVLFKRPVCFSVASPCKGQQRQSNDIRGGAASCCVCAGSISSLGKHGLCKKANIVILLHSCGHLIPANSSESSLNRRLSSGCLISSVFTRLSADSINLPRIF